MKELQSFNEFLIDARQTRIDEQITDIDAMFKVVDLQKKSDRFILTATTKKGSTFVFDLSLNELLSPNFINNLERISLT